MAELFLNRQAAVLYDADERVFDAHARAWRRVPEAATGGEAIALDAAVRWLQRESGKPVRAPVAVIGPREATAAQLLTAEKLGAGLADRGLTIICGGLAGVMTAAAKGASGAGGQAVGLLPGDDWREAHPYVTTVIATGIGVARNAIIARSALCLIAVGGGYGTLSEMAYGMQFGRPVFALEGAPAVEGVAYHEDVEAALTAVDRVAVNLDGIETAWR